MNEIKLEGGCYLRDAEPEIDLIPIRKLNVIPVEREEVQHSSYGNFETAEMIIFMVLAVLMLITGWVR